MLVRGWWQMWWGCVLSCMRARLLLLVLVCKRCFHHPRRQQQRGWGVEEPADAPTPAAAAARRMQAWLRVRTPWLQQPPLPMLLLELLLCGCARPRQEHGCGCSGLQSHTGACCGVWRGPITTAACCAAARLGVCAPGKALPHAQGLLQAPAARHGVRGARHWGWLRWQGLAAATGSASSAGPRCVGAALQALAPTRQHPSRPAHLVAPMRCP